MALFSRFSKVATLLTQSSQITRGVSYYSSNVDDSTDTKWFTYKDEQGEHVIPGLTDDDILNLTSSAIPKLFGDIPTQSATKFLLFMTNKNPGILKKLPEKEQDVALCYIACRADPSVIQYIKNPKMKIYIEHLL